MARLGHTAESRELTTEVVIFDTVDFTAIAPGTFRAMPSMRKITFLATNYP